MAAFEYYRRSLERVLGPLELHKNGNFRLRNLNWTPWKPGKVGKRGQGKGQGATQTGSGRELLGERDVAHYNMGRIFPKLSAFAAVKSRRLDLWS